MNTLISGDQNPFWDGPLKLLVLAQAGYTVRHLIHSADLFSRPDAELENEGDWIVSNEHHRPAGTTNRWTATLEVVPFLGAMHVAPKDFQDAGVDLARLAAYRGVTLKQAVADLTEGDWVGLSCKDPTIVGHGVTIDDLSEHLGALRRPLFHNLATWLDGESVVEGARAKLNRQMDFNVFVTSSAGRTVTLPEAVIEKLGVFLEAHGVEDIELSTSVDDFAPGKPTPMMHVFLTDYPTARRLYNEAAHATGGEKMDLLEDNELPFYAVVRLSDDRVVRRELSYEMGDDYDRVLARVSQGGEVLAVLGKAIPLLGDLRTRGPMVLPHGGSVYAPQAIQFSDAVAHLLPHDVVMHPIYRVYFHALDALEHVTARFTLPEYLAEAFGQETISGHEFAHRWRGVVEEAQREVEALSAPSAKLLKQIAMLESRDLLSETARGLVGYYLSQKAEYGRLKKAAFKDVFARGISAEEKERRKAEAARATKAIDACYQPGDMKAIEQTILNMLEAARTAALRRHLCVIESLTYWNKRPFTHWVVSLPGWLEAILERAEVRLDPLCEAPSEKRAASAR